MSIYNNSSRRTVRNDSGIAETGGNRKITPFHPGYKPISNLPELSADDQYGTQRRREYLQKKANLFVDQTLRFEKIMHTGEVKQALRDYYNLPALNRDEAIQGITYYVYTHPAVDTVDEGKGSFRLHYIGAGISGEE